MKNFQENYFPKFQKDLAALVGKEVPVEADWESFLAVEDTAGYLEDHLDRIHFSPILKALSAIAIDDMGKEAIAEGVKKVVVTCKSGRYYAESAITFEDGVITIDHALSNVDNESERVDYLVRLLETKL